MKLLLIIVKNVEVARMAIYLAVVIVNGAMANVFSGVSFYLSYQYFYWKLMTASLPNYTSCRNLYFNEFVLNPLRCNI